MDRKQAVTILKRKTTIPGDGYTWEQINEAIDMAIAALSPPNEPLTIEQLRAELEQVKRERDAAIEAANGLDKMIGRAWGGRLTWNG